MCLRPAKVSYDDLLTSFWEAHNPTLGCARAPIGSQYHSAADHLA
jgi:peptide methionine sulfoxide reductase MsrA